MTTHPPPAPRVHRALVDDPVECCFAKQRPVHEKLRLFDDEPAGGVKDVVESPENGNDVSLSLTVGAAVRGEVFKALVPKRLRISRQRLDHGLGFRSAKRRVLFEERLHQYIVFSEHRVRENDVVRPGPSKGGLQSLDVADDIAV